MANPENTEKIKKTLVYILNKPTKASLRALLRPSFTFNENDIEDVTLQLAMQLCLMGNDWFVSALLSSDNKVNDLYTLFNQLAAKNEEKTEAEKTEEAARENEHGKGTKAERRAAKEAKQNRAAQEIELKKLKKHIHAFARLENHDPKKSGETQIVNLNKLLAHYNNNLAEFEECKKLLIKYGDPAGSENPDLGSDFPTYKKKDDQFNEFSENYHLRKIARAEFDRLEKLLALDHSILKAHCDKETDKETNDIKYKPKQPYLAVDGLEPVTDEEYRTTRKKQKGRINKFSFAISLIVGIGEGLIAATFVAATWPFLIAVLAVGIPAAICNYVLLRNDSYSVIKEIWFGKSTDTPRQKTIKTIGSIFSGAAGLSYGFLSFGSALVTLGHLIFGLSVAAALATPPIALIVLSSVVAVVTAIAIATLYDFMLRKWVDEGFTDKLIKIKDDFIDFFRPENEHWDNLTPAEKRKHVFFKVIDTLVHVVFLAVALVIATFVTIATTLLFKHKATTIFSTTFGLAHAAAEKVSLSITIAMGALINSLFYIRSATYMVNVVKKTVLAIIHPVDTWNKIKASFSKFSVKNIYQKTESAVRAVKRMFLFGTVVANSGVGQGWGIGKSHVAQAGLDASTQTFTGVDLSHTAVYASSVTAGVVGSGGANLRAALGATGVTAALSGNENDPKTEVFRVQKDAANKAVFAAGEVGSDAKFNTQPHTAETKTAQNTTENGKGAIPHDHLSPALFKLPSSTNTGREEKLRLPHGKMGLFNPSKGYVSSKKPAEIKLSDVPKPTLPPVK
ncbi:MAG: hypothetical protein NTZ67_07065 [Gammaproteobacteria bacterium]|nr:hypothetical protein [Gammaproteobacteria bacterium]